VAEQGCALRQSVSPDQEFQVPSLGTFSGDNALAFNSEIEEPGAGTNQEGVIFYWMKASYSQKPKVRFSVGFGSRGHPCWNRIDTETRDDYGFRIRPGEMTQDMPAVELRDGDAKKAMLKFDVEIYPMQQQIGAVQGEAVADSQKAGRHHRNPGAKISVVNMDVIDFMLSQQHGVICAEPGV
jgi:hypothetical protein